jgi:hypothetical protein
MPAVGVVNAGSADASARFAATFRKGLGETGYVEGQNVTIEWVPPLFRRRHDFNSNYWVAAS